MKLANHAPCQSWPPFLFIYFSFSKFLWNSHEPNSGNCLHRVADIQHFLQIWPKNNEPWKTTVLCCLWNWIAIIFPEKSLETLPRKMSAQTVGDPEWQCGKKKKNLRRKLSSVTIFEICKERNIIRQAVHSVCIKHVPYRYSGHFFSL